MGKRTEKIGLVKQKLTRLDNTVATQMQEMEMVRQKVYELERNQVQIKQRYLCTRTQTNVQATAEPKYQI